MKDKMKKFLATLLAVALVAVACCVFASAEDTNLALNKSYTTIGIYTAEGAAAPSYPDEDGKTLTDGVKAPALFSVARVPAAFSDQKPRARAVFSYYATILP